MELRNNLRFPKSMTRQGSALRGAIGVGTWDTRVEFKDVLVQGSDGKTLLKPDFSLGLDGWRTYRGEWTGASGVLTQSSRDVDCRITSGNREWTDYTYTLKARGMNGTEGFLAIFAARDSETLYWWSIGGLGNTHAVEKLTLDSKQEVPGTAVDVRITTGTWYAIKIALHGSTADCFLLRQVDHQDQPRYGLFPAARCGTAYVFNNGDGPRPGTAIAQRQLGRMIFVADNLMPDESPVKRLSDVVATLDLSSEQKETLASLTSENEPKFKRLREKAWACSRTNRRRSSPRQGRFRQTLPRRSPRCGP